jgi:hypothetical protein
MKIVTHPSKIQIRTAVLGAFIEELLTRVESKKVRKLPTVPALQ